MTIIKGLRPDHEFESIIDRGDLIGEGNTRRVFSVFGCPEVVIKESKVPFNHDNFVEWIVWNALIKMQDNVIGTNPNIVLKDKFAECIAISHSAKFLIMERLSPIDTAVPYGSFPSWLQDKKPSSYGLRNGRIKSLDYAMVNFYEVLNPDNWVKAPPNSL